MINSPILALQEALAQPQGKEALVVAVTVAMAVAMTVAVELFRKRRILSVSAEIIMITTVTVK